MGWNNTIRYKNFDLNVFFRGAFGHDLLNSYRGFYENLESTTVGNWNVVKTKYYDPEITKAQVNSSHVERQATLNWIMPHWGTISRLNHLLFVTCVHGFPGRIFL